jgi:hypothetical protein
MRDPESAYSLVVGHGVRSMQTARPSNGRMPWLTSRLRLRQQVDQRGCHDRSGQRRRAGAEDQAAAARAQDRGVAAVLTAEALARPAPAAAANGDPVILGQLNTETSQTTITDPAFGGGALAVNATGGGGGNAIEASNLSGFGVAGDGLGAGVRGVSSTGDGVQGESTSHNGVYGQSGTTFSVVFTASGVHGITDSAGGAGVLGENASVSGAGVLGESLGAGGVGVSGTAAGGFGIGVVGKGGDTGVQGSGGGIGVQGIASGAGGIGVDGRSVSASGAGVLAENTAGGDALVVSGTAAFSRSGVLTVAAGKSSATQTGVALTSASLVLATLQQDRPGVWVRSAVPKLTASSFTVHLSKAAPARTIPWRGSWSTEDARKGRPTGTRNIWVACI